MREMQYDCTGVLMYCIEVCLNIMILCIYRIVLHFKLTPTISSFLLKISDVFFTSEPVPEGEANKG